MENTHIYFLSLFLLFSLYESIISQDDEKIIFAFQMFRHGARSPVFGIENNMDKYHEHWEENGELTFSGKRMLYLLGTKFRKRYNNFLSNKYSPQEIYIKSTDSNRTIESVYSYLQGLYPAENGVEIKEEVRFNKNITYPPNIKYQNDFDEIINKYNMNETGNALPYKMNVAPVHIIYNGDHDFDLYNENLCPYRDILLQKSHSSNEVKDFVKKLLNDTGDLFQELEPNNDTSFMNDYWTIYKYMDTILCDDRDQRNYEYLKNNYGGDNIINILRNYSKEYLDMNYFDQNFPESDKEVGIVSNSATMKNILSWMENAKNNEANNIESYLKFVIYSAHDTSVGSLDHFMRTAFGSTLEDCNFACTRFLELYKKGENYFVRYLKGDNTIKFDVNYEEFTKNVSKIVWDDKKVSEYCKFNDEEKKEENPDNTEDKKTPAFHIMIVLIIIDIILLLFVIAYCVSKRN